MAKILIVDDNPMIVDSFDSILSRAGYQVLRSRDGEDGLIVAESENPEIIVLDMIMPKIHGIEFLKKYDVLNKHRDTKVIVFSSLDSGDLVRQATELGAWKYTIKLETSPKQMLELVNQAAAEREKKIPEF